jgi:hypothetical protein
LTTSIPTRAQWPPGRIDVGGTFPSIGVREDQIVAAVGQRGGRVRTDPGAEAAGAGQHLILGQVRVAGMAVGLSVASVN